METENKIDINFKNVFGISTSKYSTFILNDDSPYIIDLPCVRWDIKKKERIFIKNLHSSIIQYMHKKKDVVLSVDDAGEFLFSEYPNYDKKFSFLIGKEYEKTHHVHWIDDYIACCSDYFKKNTSKIFVFKIDVNSQKSTLVGSIEGDYFFTCFCNKSPETLCVIQQDDEDQNKGSNLIILKGKEFKTVKKIELGTGKVLVTGFETNKENTFVCYALSSKLVYLFDLVSLQITKKFELTTFSRIYCIKFQKINNEEIIFIAKDSKLFEYNMKKETKEITKIPNSPNMFFCVTPEKNIWTCSESCLRFFNEKVEYSVSLLQIAGCGVKISDTLVVNGDLTGNLFLFDTKSSKLLKKVFVGGSVRCLCKKPNLPNIQIGCFDGNVWDYNYEKNTLKRLFSTTHGVNCMEWEKSIPSDSNISQTTEKSKKKKKKKKKKPIIFACGTTGGFLLICQSNPKEDFVRIRLSIKAHKPWAKSESDDRFGSISKYSEVWSLAFSPENDFISTASEDQTVCIWCTQTGDKIHLLSGHESAVTCVRWERVSSIGEIICSISDDRRVCIWRNNAKNLKDKTKWHLFHIFQSTHGLYWHTLTYCEIHQKKAYLVVVTQNGYVLILNIPQRKLVYKKKIHRGSIEGLSYDSKQDIFCTISADCCSSVFKIQ